MYSTSQGVLGRGTGGGTLVSCLVHLVILDCLLISFHRQFDTGSRADVSVSTLRWVTHMITARHMMSTGYSAQGFQLLNECLDQYPSYLRANHPYLLFKTWIATMGISSRQRDLESMLWKYYAGAAETIFGPC